MLNFLGVRKMIRNFFKYQLVAIFFCATIRVLTFSSELAAAEGYQPLHQIKENEDQSSLLQAKEEEMVALQDPDLDDFMVKKSFSIKAYSHLKRNRINILKKIIIVSLIGAAVCYATFRFTQSDFFQSHVLTDYRVQSIFRSFGRGGKFFMEALRMPYELRKDMPNLQQMLDKSKAELDEEMNKAKKARIEGFVEEYLKRKKSKPEENRSFLQILIQNAREHFEENQKNLSAQVSAQANQFFNHLTDQIEKADDEACIAYIKENLATNPDALREFEQALSLEGAK